MNTLTFICNAMHSFDARRLLPATLIRNGKMNCKSISMGPGMNCAICDNLMTL